MGQSNKSHKKALGGGKTDYFTRILLQPMQKQKERSVMGGAGCQKRRNSSMGKLLKPLDSPLKSRGYWEKKKAEKSLWRRNCCCKAFGNNFGTTARRPREEKEGKGGRHSKEKNPGVPPYEAGKELIGEAPGKNLGNG